MDWEIIQTLLETALMAILSVLIPYLGLQIRAWLQAKLSQAQMETVLRLVRVAVLAVEQEDMQEKKRRAIAYAEHLLREHGIHIQIDRLSAMIEAAVYEELTRWETNNP
jgi:hypothetical protein